MIKRILMMIFIPVVLLAQVDQMYKAKAGETEVQRTRNFKKYHVRDLPDGKAEYRIAGEIAPIHYKEDAFSTRDDDWLNIDLTIRATPGKTWDAENTTNGFKTRFWNNRTVNGRNYNYVARYERAGQWLQMAPKELYWENSKGDKQIIPMVEGKKLEIESTKHMIKWDGIWGDGIDFKYNVCPDEFFKTVVINDRSALPPCILSDTVGLRLSLSMDLAWKRKCEPGNGFGKNFDASSFGVIDSVLEKKEIRKERFAYVDSLLRETWWFQVPMVWDYGRRHVEKINYSVERSRHGVRLILSVPAAIFDRSTWMYPIYIDTDISEHQTAASSDDARNYGGTFPGDGSYADTDAYYYIGSFTTPRFYINGFRFQTIPIPKDATISSATMSLKCATATSANIEIDISAEDVDDAATYSTPGHEPDDSYDARTTAKVDWDVTDDFVLDTWYTTASIVTVVQEIVNRASWASDNDIAFVFVDGDATASGRVYMYNYDQAGNVSGAKFNASYTTGWTHIANEVPNANLNSVNEVAKASIDKVNEVD